MVLVFKNFRRRSVVTYYSLKRVNYFFLSFAKSLKNL